MTLPGISIGLLAWFTAGKAGTYWNRPYKNGRFKV
jgi:hypothetical protein